MRSGLNECAVYTDVRAKGVIYNTIRCDTLACATELSGGWSQLDKKQTNIYIQRN